MYLSIGGNQRAMLDSVVLFCYGIMLVSKLTLTTNTELYCSSVRLFCLDTVRYSRKQSSIIIEQAESDRVSVYRQSHQHRTNSEKQP